MPVAGTSRFTTCGREAVVGPGDAVWVGGGEAGFQETHGDFDFVCLQVPKRALRGAVPNLEDSICRRIPAETPALRLLRLYAGTLEAGENASRPEAQRVIAAHVRDLIAAALGATHGGSHTIGRLARRATAGDQTDIEASLDQPDLSTATIAARHRMSPRQLQRLFETRRPLGHRLHPRPSPRACAPHAGRSAPLRPAGEHDRLRCRLQPPVTFPRRVPHALRRLAAGGPRAGATPCEADGDRGTNARSRKACAFEPKRACGDQAT